MKSVISSAGTPGKIINAVRLCTIVQLQPTIVLTETRKRRKRWIKEKEKKKNKCNTSRRRRKIGREK